MPPIAVLLLAMSFCGTPQTTFAQINFQPLEKGEYEEVEERLLVLRGVEADAEFSAWLRYNDNKEFGELTENLKNTPYQNLRFGLRTVTHPDVSINMVLQLGNNLVKTNELRDKKNSFESRSEGSDNGVALYESWLRYEPNPRSPIYIGKKYLSLGGNRGAVFEANIPAITFDCRAKSWCVPFGTAFVGEYKLDVINHISLLYTFWDEEAPAGRKRHFSNELFIFEHTESNIPLGKNLGPGFSDYKKETNNPEDNEINKDPTLIYDDNNTLVYYDVKGIYTYGFHLNWENPILHFRLQVLGVNGERVYHPYRRFNIGYEGQTLSTGEEINSSYTGRFYESELNFYFDKNELTLQTMNASGDEEQAGYDRNLGGYYEITPGSYRGSQLFFNGFGPSFYDGGGLGHSVNNIQMNSLKYSWLNPDKKGFLFSMSVHDLKYNNPILNEDDELVSNIGTEINIKWKTALRHQTYSVIEANHLFAKEAFRLNDYTKPVSDPDDFSQLIFRLIYSF